MFGYVKTDLANMYVKDTILYKAMYCGLCKAIGKVSGQRGRLVLNYDLTFLSVLLHNLTDTDVKIEKQHCVIHTITKRPVAIPDKLTERIAALNVILARYKLNDDVLDNGKGRVKRAFFAKAYKKAKRKEPELDKIVKNRYAELIKYEKANSDSIDMVADPFGNMMVDVVNELLGDKCVENVKELAYNLGKWIYLIDAVDDFDKDKKKGNFNVFINVYPEINNKEALLKEKLKDILVVFAAVLTRINELAKTLEYRFNHDLIDNVLLRGLNVQTKNILENQKCKSTTKF